MRTAARRHFRRYTRRSFRGNKHGRNAEEKDGLDQITVLCLTLAFILFAGAGAIGFRALFRIYDGKIPIIANNHKPIDLAALPTPNAELFSEALSKDTDYYETGEIVEVPIYEQKKIDRFITSMVIVIQNGSIKSEEKQTDMIFLASYNQLLQKFTVVSVARDTIVPLSEDEWARISAAYARGGVGLLINTLNDLFGLDLQNYVVTGTDELKLLADGIDGIPATLTKQEAKYISEQTQSALSAGKQPSSPALSLPKSSLTTLNFPQNAQKNPYGFGDLQNAHRHRQYI